MNLQEENWHFIAHTQPQPSEFLTNLESVYPECKVLSHGLLQSSGIKVRVRYAYCGPELSGIWVSHHYVFHFDVDIFLPAIVWPPGLPSSPSFAVTGIIRNYRFLSHGLCVHESLFIKCENSCWRCAKRNLEDLRRRELKEGQIGVVVGILLKIVHHWPTEAARYPTACRRKRRWTVCPDRLTRKMTDP